MFARYKVFLIILFFSLFWAGCHEDGDGPRIERLDFHEKTKTVRTGQNATVGIRVTPENAKSSEKIRYSTTGTSVKINEGLSSNDAVVFTATGRTNTVIMAKTEGAADYLQIVIEGAVETGIPYITVTDNVLEIPLGSKKHFMSTLQNGNPGDYLSFVYSNGGRDIVNYETANNTVVVEGLRAGSDIITVKHPKARYGVDVLVFVLENGESVRYITGENAVFMEAGESRDYHTRLVNVPASEAGYSVYQVTEGNDVVSVTGHGEFCSIETKEEGVAKVRVTNRSVPYPFEFQIIVRGQEKQGYISMSSNFVILEDREIKNIYAYYNGDAPGDLNDKYKWHFEDGVTNVAEVTRYGDHFAIKALRNGSAKLIIENEYSIVKQEVLIIVNFETTASGEMFITTSQNVMHMELGGVDAVLKMKLVGGTQADRNSFEWMVEDSSVIEAFVPDGHGTVKNRAMIYPDEIQTAEAKITAKKAGTTYITVTNAKAPRSEVRVLVKVYPKGIFSGGVVSLGGTGLLKVQTGKTMEVGVMLLGGSYQNVGELVWHIKDESVAKVNGAALTGVLEGLKAGITELIVTGNNVLEEYRALVVVHENGEDGLIPYIYSDKLQYKMYVGQMIKTSILHPNIENEVLDFSVINTNVNVVYTVKQGSVLILNAVEPGEAELIINTGIPGCNTLTFIVSVETAELNTERPYVITGASSVVTHIGGAVEYEISIAGAGEADKSKIIWTIDDEKVASLEMVNGTNVILRGIQKGQTVLRAQSAKSANVKEVVVFVAATGDDALNKITLGLGKINYVLKTGESFFVKLVTNASENQKLQIRWGASDADILDIKDNYDTAFITAVEEGTCIITVDTRDQSHMMPLVLYVTVRSAVFDEFEMGFPSSVVIIKGQSKIIRGNVPAGFGGMSGIIWNLDDDNVVHVMDNGLEATLWGRNPGQTFLTVSYYGFSKKILVICAESGNDLENLWYFTADKTYFRIKKNEEARINLLFGENGFPEDEKKKIWWKEDMNNAVISLSYSGESAKVMGKNPGVARIKAGHDWVGKEIEILVEVIDTVTGSQEYYMQFPEVNKMLLGVPQTIPVSLYKDNYLYTQGYGLITLETEDKGVVQAELLNNTLRIMGCLEGREYVTLTHPLAGQRRMLVVVYEGKIPADDPVVYTDKQYWSVYEGRDDYIQLKMSGGGENTESGILWVNDDPKIVRLDSSDRMRVKITGLAFGSTTIRIMLNGKLAETLYVSVAKGEVKTDIAVSTESIIIMALETDTRHTTKIIGGANVLDYNWSVGDKRVAEILEFGDQCVLYPKSEGMTDLTVSGSGYERKIIVVVVRTEAEKMSANYLNMDKRYFKLKKGESTVIFPYYKAVRPSVAANDPLLRYNSGVVGVEREGGGFVITGRNEGIEMITIGNSQCKNVIQIAVEVSGALSGGVSENKNLVYITTENNLMVVTPNTYGILVKIDVIGEYFGTNADFIWSKDSILAGWEVSGTVAFLNTGKGTGEVNITVENKYCQYPLKIKIIIEDKNEVTGIPYVYADRTVYQFNLADDMLRVGFRVYNLETVDYSQTSFTKTGNAADVSLNGSYFEVKARNQGVSEIEIKYPGAISLKLYFIVQDSVENTAVYLTTAMNYVVVPRSKTKVIDVALINYAELNSENIKWSSSDYGKVTVVGSGRTVQIYGVEIGFAILTVKHPLAYNDLEIMVKVVEENDTSGVAYLTTKDNIIETFVQNNTLQVMVSKVGGKLPELETAWMVDDVSVVSVMGSGGTGYVVPKKAGIAKITVTERETGKLDIIVIVKEVKAGTEYIETDDSVVQIYPGNMGSTTIQVRLVGGNETDNRDFEWQVYSQIPTDYEVAKNGGTVISLFGMGNRASVLGNYVGTARIRVTHPKAQIPLYIAVQVTNFNALTFNESETVITNGNIYFAGINLPNYENFMGKVEYSTDNPAVCVVMGSEKVALLQAQGVGRANISAVVRGTSLHASMAVLVIERDNYAEVNIIVSKTTYLLNPRERPFQIEARLQGAGVTDESHYGLKWEARLYDSTGRESISKAIAIYPLEEEVKEGELVTALRGTGPIIQVEVLNPMLPEGKAFDTKEIVIIVSQPEITSRTKTIYIRISDVSGIFTLSKSDITMNQGDMADLSCNILGGKASDYNEVVWIVETDSFGRRIAQLMTNRGKDVRIYGENDGTVYVTAIYRNEIAECRVQVRAGLYLNLQYEVFFTYPGAKNEKGGLIAVDYEVRPYTSQLRWSPTGTVKDPNNEEKTIAVVTVVTQDYATGKGKILIDPVNEGSFVLTAMMSNKAAQMTVIIKYAYRLQIPNREFHMQPGETTAYAPEPEKYPWDYTSKYVANKKWVDGYNKVGDSIYIPFVISPPDHVVVFNDATKSAMNKYGIKHEISPILRTAEMEGRGIIKLTVDREIPHNAEPLKNDRLILTLNLTKPLGGVVDPSFFSSGSPNNEIYVTSRLPRHQTLAIPVFQRVYGRYSNENPVKYKFYDGDKENNYLPESGKKQYLANSPSPAPGANAFDVNTGNWQKWPTGILPQFNGPYQNSTSEYLKLAESYKYNNMSQGHTVAYNLEIGDGEEHYILLDRTHEGMYYELDDDETNNSIDEINLYFQTHKTYNGIIKNAPSFELVDAVEGKAIKVSAPSDFIVYDRINVKHLRVLTFMLFDNSAKIRTHRATFPPTPQPSNDMYISAELIRENNNYRYVYRVIDTAGNMLSYAFQYHHDSGYDGTINFYDINSGTAYGFSGSPYDDIKNSFYHLRINNNSKFKDVPNFSNVLFQIPYTYRGAIGYGSLYENHISKVEDVNYVAIYQTALDNGVDTTLAMNNPSLMLNYLPSSNSGLMGDYYDKKTAKNFENVTLYIKRSWEQHNKIYPLNSFLTYNSTSDTYGDFIFDYTVGHNSTYKRVITQDITGLDGIYQPVATTKEIPARTIRTDLGKPLTITYKNSYNEKNTIKINITHKIRATHCMEKDHEAVSWNDLTAIDAASVGDSGTFGNYNLYGYNFYESAWGRR
jgi:hypothetical protein